MCPNDKNKLEKDSVAYQRCNRKKWRPRLVVVGGILAVIVIMGGISVLGISRQEKVKKSPDENNINHKVDIKEPIASDEETFVMRLEDYVGQRGKNLFSVWSTSREFIKEHGELFPAASLEQVTPFVNHEIQFTHIEEGKDKYGNQVMAIIGGQVVEQTKENVIEIKDQYGNSYILYYEGGKGNVQTGSVIDLYGVPVGTLDLEEATGDATKALLLAGCWVESTFTTECDIEIY